MFFDELDQFLVGFRTRNLARSEEISPEEEEDIIDELLDLYLLAWYEGSQDAARELLIETEPSIEDAREAIDRPIEGKTFRDRVRDYLNGDMGQTTGTPAEAIARVAETDSVRLYNEAGLSTAVRAGQRKRLGTRCLITGFVMHTQSLKGRQYRLMRTSTQRMTKHFNRGCSQEQTSTADADAAFHSANSRKAFHTAVGKLPYQIAQMVKRITEITQHRWEITSKSAGEN